MKKIVSPLSNGGAPWTDDLLAGILGQEGWTAFEALLQNLYPSSASGNVGVIISGCVVSGAGPYNCSAGIVYLNGQFMSFPGFTALTLPQYIVPATLVTNTDIWGDGSSHNLWTQQDAAVQSSLPGSGQYISLTTLGAQGTPGGQRYGMGGMTAWTTLTLLNSWTNASTPVARWRFLGNGLIELSGGISVPAGVNPIFAAIPASWGSVVAWGNGVARPIVNIRGANYRNDGFLFVNNNSGNLVIQTYLGAALTSGDVYYIDTIFTIDAHSL